MWISSMNDIRRRLWRWLGGVLGGIVLGTAMLGASGGSPTRTVLFDQGHGQLFVIERAGSLDLSTLAGLFRQDGFSVRAMNTPLTDERLADVDALVISGAFVSLTSEESEAVVHFVERGGRLCVMLHVAPPMAPFLARMGVLTSLGVVREERNLIDAKPQNFYVTQLTPHPLVRGLERFAVYGSWALLARDSSVTVIAQSSPRAWMDLNRNGLLDGQDVQRALGIAATGHHGRGELVVFADDSLFHNQFLHDENVQLAQNLVRWLRPAVSAAVSMN